MGCGNSKSVATVRTSSTTSISNQSARKSSADKAVFNSNNSSSSNNNDDNNNHNRPVSSTKNNNNSKNTNSQEHPEIAVFKHECNGLTSDPVDNAKPRLPHSGIRRSGSSLETPIVPYVDKQDDPVPSTSKADAFNISELSIYPDSDIYLPVLKQNLNTERTETSHSQTYNRSRPPISADESTAMKTVDNYNLIANGYHHQRRDSKDDQSPFNTSRTNLSGSRACSAKAGSVLTTTALNASIVTSLDGDDRSDIHTGTPSRSTSVTDLEDSAFRILSITPSVHTSVDTTPAFFHDKSFGPIMEEYEGGFTPRSLNNGDIGPYVDTPRTLIPYEVTDHNRKVGWDEWVIYIGKVYDIKVVRKIFIPIIEASRETSRAEKLEQERQREEQRKDVKEPDDYDSYYDDDSDFCYDPNEAQDNLDEDDVWSRRGIQILTRNGLDHATIKANIGPACVGSVCQPNDTRYWEDIRKDTKLLLNDLIQEDFKDKLSKYLKEYLGLLQRWVKKYRTFNPDKPKVPDGDPNHHAYPLPEEIAENPTCLRQWLEVWESFNFDIPENGPWPVIESDDIDLGDPHEIFAATLKSHIDLSPLNTAIDGEAGWRVIKEGLFADDVMTAKQKETDEQRKKRTDLLDPKRMRRRRMRILKYFVQKYDMDQSKVQHFLSWADNMEQGYKEFLSLCESC